MSSRFYLNQLILQNFVTFKSHKISFTKGLNSIIGETGSGKSLILDAIHFILGTRGDKKIIRKNSDFSLIEATFICEDEAIQHFFDQMGFPIENNELIVKRVFHSNGSNKNFLNNLSCNLSHLHLFSKKFIDVVGQFENQKLLSDSYQLEMLDQYAKNQDALHQYKVEFSNFQKLKTELEELYNSRETRERRLDFLNFQIQEIENLNPSIFEENDLLDKKSRFINQERAQKIQDSIIAILDGNESHQGIKNEIGLLKNIFKKNLDLFQNELNSTNEIEDKLYELGVTVSKLCRSDFSLDDFEQVVEKLDAYQHLKRKYRGNIESVLESYKEFLLEREKLLSLEFNVEQLEKNVSSKFNQISILANKLHETRICASYTLEQELTTQVRLLNMKGASFKINLDHSDNFTEDGNTKCVFMAETNLGEGFFKIKEIASGGELSRILLAIRQILSSNDSISIFLFDEIDSGIGGETAKLIGSSLKKISQSGQVIAITHLPQIAQHSDQLILVKKDQQIHQDQIRTESFVEEIYGERVIQEARSMITLN